MHPKNEAEFLRELTADLSKLMDKTVVFNGKAEEYKARFGSQTPFFKTLHEGGDRLNKLATIADPLANYI
ncbi:MAG: hypothetical protein HOO93_13295 [Methyloglobulus sp.]|nr:hypothetical protein [Methyloglobulus sp.]